MLGAVIGDIAGSRFEWGGRPPRSFSLLTSICRFTDDSAMTAAVCAALLHSREDFSDLSRQAVLCMQQIGRQYPHCGYGASFIRWIFSDPPQPYQSFGNGSAMRVSGCGWVGRSLAEVRTLARAVTAVSHDHPEGLKGAEAVAAVIFLARSGCSCDEIRVHVRQHYYPLDFTLDEIRDSYQGNASCQGTVPQAIEAFLEADDFVQAVQLAVSLGGDTDTLGAIAGSMAEAGFGIPAELREQALHFLPQDLRGILLDFEAKYPPVILP